MGDQDSNIDTSDDFRDRRSNTDLRLIFDKACEITAPFFDSRKSWGSSSLSMYARQTLHEAYPELTQQEVALLFAGVARHHMGLSKKTDGAEE